MLKFVVPFLLSFASLAQYSATSTQFSSVTMDQCSPFQLSAGIGLDPMRSQEIQGSLIYYSPAGIQAGLGVHGGITRSPIFGVIGIDLMLGYLAKPKDYFLLGVKTQAGITYTGIKDPSVEPEHAFSLPISVEAVFGAQLKNGTVLHVSPGIELGHTMKGGDVVWKSGVGYRLAIGAGLRLTEQIVLSIGLSPTIAEGEFFLNGNLQTSWNF